MKKTLIAMAALAATSAAFAQSNVTLSGQMDLSVSHTAKVAAGAANFAVGNGYNNIINFGITEDLGGGMRAMGQAQIRFNPNTGLSEGSAGQRPLFQGATRVGLAGGFGTVMLGRGLTALQAANGGNSDPWGVGTVAGSLYAVGYATDYAAGGEGRIDQAIFYTSPSISGVQLGVTYSPRKLTSATVTSTKTLLSLNALYTAGPLVVGYGRENNRVGDTINQLYGNYNLGVVKLFASTATVKGGDITQRDPDVTFSATSSAVPGLTTPVAPAGKIKNHTVGLTAPFGAMTLRAGFSTWNGDGTAGDPDDRKIGLGIKYDLSKRTSVYTNLATTTRKNNVSTTVPGTTTQRAFDLGVNHTF